MIHSGAMVRFAMDRPWPVIGLMVALCLLSGASALRMRVMADPGGMLAEDDFARRFDDRAAREFDLHDVVILGVVNDRDDNGVFNPDTLKKILVLSRFAATLRDPKHPERRVIAREITAPDNVDPIGPDGLGKVRFRWLMKTAPATRQQALAIRDRALDDPLLRGGMVSPDGRALAITIPVSDKEFTHRVALALQAKIREIGTGRERYYITGISLAEATFAVETPFKAVILAPLILLPVFLALYLFFRRIWLAATPLAVATVTTLSTMGLFIACGNSLQLISSMIPVFIGPLALLHPVRILSRFCTLFRESGERRTAMERAMADLSAPMSRAAVTQAAGFAALAMVPVPAVRTFGIFLALGSLLAWLLAVLFLPAAIMLIRERNLKIPGTSADGDPTADNSPVSRFLRRSGRIASGRPWLVLGSSLAAAAVGILGAFLLQVNDNPLRWLTNNHPIRVADRVLASRFPGTHRAFLVLRGDGAEMTPRQAADWLTGQLDARLADVPVIRQKVLAEIAEAAAESDSGTAMADRLEKSWTTEIRRLPPDDAVGFDRWSTALDSLGRLRNQEAVFKRPDVLAYIAGLQRHLERLEEVGSSVSVVDLVRKAHQELLEGDPRYRTVPDTVNAVAQALDAYRASKRPERLRHLVNRDCSQANILFRLTDGDSADMERVSRDAAAYLAAEPPPVRLRHHWAGPTFMHRVWQDQVTRGMLRWTAVGAVVAFLLVSLQFRSPLWGGMAMIPAAGSLAAMAAVTGLTGRDLDVAAALLLALPLGTAVDFAIHFLHQAREQARPPERQELAVAALSGEPVRAMVRATAVILAGCVPLLFAPPVPFRTAAILLAATVLSATLATLWTLPALLTLGRRWLFRERDETPPQEEQPA